MKGESCGRIFLLVWITDIVSRYAALINVGASYVASKNKKE